MQEDAEAAELIKMAEAEVERRGLRLRFPPGLEDRFRADVAERRMAEVRVITRYGVCLYLGLGILINTILIPGGSLTAVLCQIGLVSLITLAAHAWWLRPGRPYVVREGAFFAICLACTLGAVLMLPTTKAPLTLRDLLFGLLPLNITIVFARPAFPFAAVLCAITGAAFLLVLSLCPTRLQPDDTAILVTLLAILSLPSLCGLHWLEQAMRQLYLRELIQRLNYNRVAAANALLTDLSHTDALTGIANRRRFDTRLAEVIAQPDPKAALLLADIDLFKGFNDQYGHAVGDACLRAVAEAFGRTLPASALLARVGGEEFAVLLTGSTLPQALAIAEALRRTVQDHPLRIGEEAVTVTVSIGVAPMPSACTAEDFIAVADAALYRAKSGGRNQVAGPAVAPMLQRSR